MACSLLRRDKGLVKCRGDQGVVVVLSHPLIGDNNPTSEMRTIVNVGQRRLRKKNAKKLEGKRAFDAGFMV